MSEVTPNFVIRSLLGELAWLPDDDEVYEWISFGEISNRVEDNAGVTIDGPFDVFDAVEFCLERGYIESREIEVETPADLRITQAGLKALEDNIGFEQFLPEAGIAQDEPIKFDPTDWTGSRLVHVDDVVLKRIRHKAHELKNIIHGTNFRSEEDRLDIVSLSNALVSLCEMATPEITLIQMILSNPKFKLYARLIAAIAAFRGATGI